jgi:putative hydrolase of the HAD superfamily
MKIRAIFFDLFETLISEFADGKRIAYRQYDYMGLLGLSHTDFKLEWRKHQDARMCGDFASYHDVIRAILATRCLPVNEEAIEALYQARLEEKEIPFRQIHSEVLSLLQSLKKHPIKIGLISNCTEEEVGGWEDSELSEYFDDYIFSYQVGISKPNKEIYMLACNRLGVRPEECIFVGDGGSNELQGAGAIGLNVVHAIWFHSFIKSEFKQLESPIKLIAEITQLEQQSSHDIDSTSTA